MFSGIKILNHYLKDNQYFTNEPLKTELLSSFHFIHIHVVRTHRYIGTIGKCGFQLGLSLGQG
jgi:hypothetical protein